MIIFDEEQYAKKIIKQKKYNTIKNQGRERCSLVRYLINLGYDRNKIIHFLFKIPMSGGDFLTKNEKNIIFEKIIDKAQKFELIKDIKIDIYLEEINIIKNIEDINARNLLFVYLVYYKWACKIPYLNFNSKKNNTIMVLENNKDLWKIADLLKMRVADRYKICNFLFVNEFYKITNFKSNNYFYIPFAVSDGEIAFTIQNFDNILGELLFYLYPEDYKRCAICGTVIKKTRSPKKYCSTCARLENIRKTKENKKNLKTKTS